MGHELGADGESAFGSDDRQLIIGLEYEIVVGSDYLAASMNRLDVQHVVESDLAHPSPDERSHLGL